MHNETLSVVAMCVGNPDDIYRIVGEIPADERWQFVPGQVVRVRQQTLSGSACLTAYEAAAV